MEAFVHGVSTRKVDDLVAALGIDAGVSKSQVSRICSELDGAVAEFRERRLDHIEFPYVFVDATLRQGPRRGPGGLQGHQRGHWRLGRRQPGGAGPGRGRQRGQGLLDRLPRSLRARGLSGVRLVISDAHEGLRSSIERVMLGAAGQRCRVHFMRNILAPVPRGSQEMVAAAIRTVFAQPDAAAVADQLDSIAGKLGSQFPVVEAMLRDAATDVCAFASFPTAHWKKVWSTNPLERVNKEIKRRTNVVGIFPNEAAVLRLAGSILLEVYDEWQIAERRYLSGGFDGEATPPTNMARTRRRWEPRPRNCSPADEQPHRR